MKPKSKMCSIMRVGLSRAVFRVSGVNDGMARLGWVLMAVNDSAAVCD